MLLLKSLDCSFFVLETFNLQIWTRHEIRVRYTRSKSSFYNSALNVHKYMVHGQFFDQILYGNPWEIIKAKLNLYDLWNHHEILQAFRGISKSVFVQNGPNFRSSNFRGQIHLLKANQRLIFSSPKHLDLLVLLQERS